MTSDEFFRWILVLIAVPGFCAAIYHRIRSSSGEKLDRRQEGWFILITLRVAGLTTWIALAVWMIRPSSLAWARMELPDSLRWAGTALFVLDMIWIVWMMHTLGANLTDTVVTRVKHTLVTSGPYRFVRNPLYTGLLVLGPVLSLVTARWIFAPVCLTMFGVLAVRLRKEEANLIARFGDEYRAYMARTGRFLPF